MGLRTFRESNIELDVRDSKIDLDVIQKIGFFQDPIDLHFKPPNDELAALTNVPISDKPDLEPSQFHVYSSSSSNMPTNKMIKDKLVSLRGYITTRMHSLDDHP
ncbi:hypothetical protein Lal_00040439 [Lupinus albus]|nr:hypothetical protein Lal_00040439 [Lupinus albus]